MSQSSEHADCGSTHHRSRQPSGGAENRPEGELSHHTAAVGEHHNYRHHWGGNPCATWTDRKMMECGEKLVVILWQDAEPAKRLVILKLHQR